MTYAKTWWYGDRVANPPGTGGRLPEFKSISRPEMLISRNSGIQNAKNAPYFGSYNIINNIQLITQLDQPIGNVTCSLKLPESQYIKKISRNFNSRSWQPYLCHWLEGSGRIICFSHCGLKTKTTGSENVQYVEMGTVIRVLRYDVIQWIRRVFNCRRCGGKIRSSDYRIGFRFRALQ